jgi:hypothetical protein
LVFIAFSVELKLLFLRIKFGDDDENVELSKLLNFLTNVGVCSRDDRLDVDEVVP